MIMGEGVRKASPLTVPDPAGLVTLMVPSLMSPVNEGSKRLKGITDKLFLFAHDELTPGGLGMNY